MGDELLLPSTPTTVEAENQTIVDWASFCREVVYDYMIVRKLMIGGQWSWAYHRNRRVKIW